MAKTTKQARTGGGIRHHVKASPSASAVTDHSHPATKRVELATTAAWQIWTLCDELCQHAARLDSLKTTPQPHHSALIIKLLASRAHELAEAAALCLGEDEENQPFADLERTVSNG
jgi:hypothetical protein